MGVRGYFAMARDIGKAAANMLLGKKPDPTAKFAAYDSSPFLLEVNNFYQISNMGSVIAGTVLRGSLVPGTKVKLMPAGKERRVISIEYDEEKVHKALEGMDIGVFVDGVGQEDILPDSVLTF